jgi:hypothetical protein
MADQVLTDDELRDRIRAIKADEETVSYERRMLHGRIDVVRSEILARLQRRAGADDASDDPLADLVRRLSAALTHSGPPPIADELERFGAGEGAPAAVDDSAADDALPELHLLADDELASLVRSLTAREMQTSARRQDLHRELDRFRAEHVARLQERFATSGEE